MRAQECVIQGEGMAVWIRVGYKPMVILVKKSAIQNEGRKKVYIPEIKPKLGVKA